MLRWYLVKNATMVTQRLRGAPVDDETGGGGGGKAVTSVEKRAKLICQIFQSVNGKGWQYPVLSTLTVY